MLWGLFTKSQQTERMAEERKQLAQERAEQMALLKQMAAASVEQAKVMQSFLDMFKVDSAPIPRMNGDQHLLDTHAREAMEKRGLPTGATEGERLRWQLANMEHM